MQNQILKPFGVLLIITFGLVSGIAQNIFYKTNPLGPIDPNNPNVSFGVERVSKDDLGIELEIMRYYDYSNPNIPDENRRGWRGSIEMRKYGIFAPKRKRFMAYSKFFKRDFMGLEMQYLHRKFTALSEFNGFTGEFTDVPVTRNIRRLSFQVGRQYVYPGGFFFEGFVGLGISQIREIHASGDGVIGDDGFFTFNRSEDGSKVVAFWNIGVRLGVATKSENIFKDFY